MPLPEPLPPGTVPAAVAAFAPKRASPIEGIDTIIPRIQELGAKLQAAEERIVALTVELRIAEAKNDQLMFAVAEAQNKETMALAVRDEALREALYNRGKLGMIKDALEDWNAGQSVPLPAKKRRAAKNGEASVPQPQPETPTSEAPKPAGEQP